MTEADRLRLEVNRNRTELRGIARTINAGEGTRLHLLRRGQLRRANEELIRRIRRLEEPNAVPQSPRT